MQILPHEIHIWTTKLCCNESEELQFYQQLPPDEQKRATRFQSPLHKRRFILARTKLRTLLSNYLQVQPETVVLDYSQQGKPFLKMPSNSRLHFNLSHSNQIAIYGITLDHAIGVDIEKSKDTFEMGVAKRFLHAQEYEHLLQLPASQQSQAFYRLWVRKEALAKAIGGGVFQDFARVPISLEDDEEILTIAATDWSLLAIFVNPEYHSAVATNQTVKKISLFNF